MRLLQLPRDLQTENPARIAASRVQKRRELWTYLLTSVWSDLFLRPVERLAPFASKLAEARSIVGSDEVGKAEVRMFVSDFI